MIKQKTIKNDICVTGLGLHSGREISVRLRSAQANCGISFRRVDLSGAPTIAATLKNVTSTTLATTLGHGENKISTVEHLMAAFSALGVDNVLVEANGPELPVFDGSAAEWVSLLTETGLVEQNAPRKIYKVTRPFRVSVGDKSIEVRPASRFSVEAHIDFGGAIGRHCFYYVESGRAFTREISRSRTFCQLKDVEMMQSRGLALGGSLDNAVVVGDDGILNPGGLRYDDEFVRHKILDFIGDLAMAGASVVGQFVLRKPGHELNWHFLAGAMAEPGLLEESVADQQKNKSATLHKDGRPILSRLALNLEDGLAASL